MIFRVLTATICLLLAGCFTMQEAATPNGAQHLFVSNYGWYLFGAIPLFCGNANPDRFFPFVMFRDDVTMDKIQGRMTDRAKTLGVEIEDMVYFNRDQVFVDVPLTSISIPIPYLLCYREVQLSGVMK